MTYAATAAWLRPRLWIGVVVGLVPWAVWIGSLAVGGWYKDADGTLVGADHLAFYSAAHLIRDGRQERMYDYLQLGHYQNTLIGWNWHGFEAYRNPPFYALLYVPTAGFSFYASLLIWTALGFALLFLAIWLLAPRHPFKVLGWSLLFYPVFATISFGQNTFLSLAIFSAVYRLAATERKFSAGLAAGLLWFKPQLLLGLFIWWLFSPRLYIRCWAGVLVTGLLLAALSWGLLPEASQAFVDKRADIVGFRGFGLWNVHTPRVFFELLLQPPENADASSARSLAIWLTTLGVAAASLWFAWRLARRSAGNVATMFPVAVFLSLWVSPHALIYEWALMIAACVVIWEKYPQHRDAWICLFALGWLALAVSTPFALFQIARLHWPCVVQVSVPVLGVAGYLAARELARADQIETATKS